MLMGADLPGQWMSMAKVVVHISQNKGTLKLAIWINSSFHETFSL
jgi:hypothetical protein